MPERPESYLFIVLEYSERGVLSREKPKIYKPMYTGRPLRKLLQKN